MSEPQYPDFTAHGYQVIEQLGRNPSAGRVSYKALSINTGQIVVIKQFQWVGGSSTLDGERQIEREIQTLRSLHHPKIPSYLDDFKTESASFCIVQEFIEVIFTSDKLIIATNENDLLHKFLMNGIYKPSKVRFSISPSMDIQVASNFERLISSYYNNNSKKISKLMMELNSRGFYKVAKNILKNIKNIFYSNSINAKNTKKTIKSVYEYNNKILDPHSSVGLKALENYYLNNDKKSENLFCLETAHPAKFGETVYKILRKNPKLPIEISKNIKKKEFYKVMPNNLAKIKNYILTNRLH